MPDYQALVAIREDILRCERRVDRAFHADLFRLLVDDDRANNKTAEEIRAKSQERLMQLGPVLERVNDEFLDPFFDRVFDIAMELKLLPEPPQSLQGREVRVTYISVLASAQRMLRTAGLERLVQFTMGLAQADVSAVKKLSVARLISLYSEMVGADPRALKSEKEMAAEAAAEARAIEQQQAAEQMNQVTQSVKNLGQTPMDKGNALGALMGSLGPIAAAAAPESQV